MIQRLSIGMGHSSSRPQLTFHAKKSSEAMDSAGLNSVRTGSPLNASRGGLTGGDDQLADLNKKLWFASMGEDPERIREVLNKGADVNDKEVSTLGRTALHFACYIMSVKSPEVVKLLLEDPRINVNETDKEGDTALHLALKDAQITSTFYPNKLECVRLLLDD